MFKWFQCLAGFLLAMLLSGCKLVAPADQSPFSRFISLDGDANFTRSATSGGETVLESRVINAGMDWNQLIVSWNAEAPAGTYLIVNARAIWPGRTSKEFTLGRWTPDNQAFPRTSVHGQADEDGTVSTDTLKLTHPARAVQIRVTLGGKGAVVPRLKFLGLSFSNPDHALAKRSPNHAAWGKIVVTPERSQQAYPQEKGWCSPATVSMVLGRWAEQMDRPELARDVPEVAAAVYDEDYAGTGNWPFNTAYAGSFSGMRGFVSRFDDLRELEDWISAGIPVVISARWNLLRPGRADTGNGHLAVCIGFTRDGDVVVNEPATNLKKRSVRCVYRREDVRRAWATSNNTVYLIYPVGIKLPANRYGHW